MEVEVEEFGGTGDTSGFDTAESTLLFSQIVELGAKREKRTRVAELDQDLAAWDYEAARLTVLADTSRAFIEALALQKRSVLAQNNLDLAQQVFGVIEKQVAAGATSPLDQTKAGLAVAQARIEQRRVHRDWNAARATLATAWGSRQPLFDRLVGDFDQLRPLPPESAVIEQIAQNPQIARWATEVAQRQAQMELARSKSIPSLTAGAGVKHLGETSDTAAVIQFSVPLPLVDKNQGGVLESRYALAKARQAQRAVELQLGAALDRAYRRLVAAHEDVAALASDVLPAAEAAHDGTRTAYTEGKIGYLDVLDAQRTLFDARGQHIEALAAYHAAVVEVESLIGRPLDTLESDEPLTSEAPRTSGAPLSQLNPVSYKGTIP
jgi:cobalt-zinc-cadmium efflux system outer membrane protein